MAFRARGGIPDLSLSVHSAERLSTNTDRTVFSLFSEEGTTPVVMNLTTLAHGKYLRINMTSTGRLYLREIEVFGTSRYTFTDTRNLHAFLTPLLTSLNLSSVTDDSICIHPSSAGGDPASPTTSVTSASPTTSFAPASRTTSFAPASPTTFLPSTVEVRVWGEEGWGLRVYQMVYTVRPEILAGNLFWRIGGFESNPPIFHPPKTSQCDVIIIAKS